MLTESFKIISATEIDKNLLLDYYKKIYPHRFNSLKNNWIWQNRSDYFAKKSPLVIFDEAAGVVAAHLGMIPFKINLNNKIYDAQWLIDFSVHPDYQRKGLGLEITKKWMEYSEVHLTCCNEKAINIFKKLGWEQNNSSFYHLLFINPFNHKKLKFKNLNFNKFINNNSKNLLFSLYKKYSYPLKSLIIENLDMAKLKSINFFSSNDKNLFNYY